MIKRLIFKSFLVYLKNFPIQRGKAFIGRIIGRIIYTVQVRTRFGFTLIIFPNNIQDHSFFDNKNLSNQIIFKEISDLKTGDTFIDIGANIGFYSLLASSRVGLEGKVFSFEPSPREYWRLLYNIIENKTSNIVPFNFGIAAENTLADFYLSEKHTGLNKLVSDNSIFFPAKTIKIPLIKLDDVIANYGINDIVDLVKIDIEGAELFALQGMQNLLLKNKIKKIVIEITPILFAGYNYRKEDIYNYLNQFRYKPVLNLDLEQYDEVFILNY